MLVVGRTNYLGIAGYYPGNPQYKGYFTYKSKSKITNSDGSSNTALFGEMQGGNVTWGGSFGRVDGPASPSWAAGFNYTGFGGPVSGGINQTTYYQFGGPHTGIVLFCFGDGSVRSLRPSIDFSTWIYITGTDDGVVINFE